MDITQTIDGADLVLRIPIKQILKEVKIPATALDIPLKQDPFYGLKGSSREFLRDVKLAFGSTVVPRRDPMLLELERKHYIKNLGPLLRGLQNKGLAMITYYPVDGDRTPRINSFKLTF